MTRNRITLICVFWAFVSCGTGHKDIPLSSQFDIIRVDSESKDYIASELFDECRIVELEMTADSYLAGVDRIYLDSLYMYIFDNRLHSVLIFDTEGRFVRKIHDMGRGPGEYVQLSDFAVDSDGHLLLMADIPAKIIVRDKNGVLLEQFPIDEAYMDLCPFGNYLYFINPPTSKTSFSFLNRITNETESIQKAIPNFNDIYTHGRFMTLTNNIPMVSRRFDKSIYSISIDNKLLKAAEVRFEDVEFLSEAEMKEYGVSSDFFAFCRKNNSVFSIVDCQIINGLWVFNTNLPYCYIYSSVTGNSYVISVLDDQQNHVRLGGFSRVAINGLNKGEICFLLKEGGLNQFGKSETGNPILFFYRLRNDL